MTISSTPISFSRQRRRPIYPQWCLEKVKSAGVFNAYWVFDEIPDEGESGGHLHVDVLVRVVARLVLTAPFALFDNLAVLSLFAISIHGCNT